MRVRGKILGALLLLVLGAGRLSAALGQVQSADVRVLGHSNYWSYFETNSGRDLLYYSSLLANTGTSRVIFNLNGTPADLQRPVLPSEIVQAPTFVGSGLGAYVEMAKRRGNITYGARYTIVSDPHTGSGEGFVQIRSYVTNNGSLKAMVGLRVLLDIQLIDTSTDDAFLSTDNGLSSFGANTLLQSITSAIPSDWWTYDQNPSANLVAHGVTWGNAFNAPATHPDAIEFCHWEDVRHEGQYDPHPAPGLAFSTYTRPDTAVVLWYTNNGQAGYTGGPSAQGYDYEVPPGQTLVFITYYGVEPKPLNTTPTPYITYTPSPTRSATPSITPTHSVSPTFSVSPTITLSHTITPTFSASPTFSVSPTITLSHTITPTFSISPTFSSTATPTPSSTLTPSFSVSPTFTVTPTFSASPTITPSFSVSPSFSASPTFSVSPTHSVSPTRSLTPTITLTLTPVPPDLILTPRPPSPNPSEGRGVWLPYILSKAATVRIKVYTVAGELVKSLEPYAAHGGANEQFWDQRNEAGALVASGVFIYRIHATDGKDEKVAFQKLAVVR